MVSAAATQLTAATAGRSLTILIIIILTLCPLCRTVMNNDPSLLRKLEQKVNQERELTEEWTEKWKEAAKILKEQSALALKQVGSVLKVPLI